MGVMSELDIMAQDGDRTVEDFMERGYDIETARSFAAIVEDYPRASLEAVERSSGFWIVDSSGPVCGPLDEDECAAIMAAIYKDL